MAEFRWGAYSLPKDTSDPNEAIDLNSIPPVRPRNLHVASYPYPHLRDDDGCVLARDFMDLGKLAFILKAVADIETV